jgi:hypothetical protein
MPALPACLRAGAGEAGHGGRGWLRNGQVESARDIILYYLRGISMATEILDGLSFTYIFESWYP